MKGQSPEKMGKGLECPVLTTKPDPDAKDLAAPWECLKDGYTCNRPTSKDGNPCVYTPTRPFKVKGKCAESSKTFKTFCKLSDATFEKAFNDKEDDVNAQIACGEARKDDTICAYRLGPSCQVRFETAPDPNKLYEGHCLDGSCAVPGVDVRSVKAVIAATKACEGKGSAMDWMGKCKAGTCEAKPLIPEAKRACEDCSSKGKKKKCEGEECDGEEKKCKAKGEGEECEFEYSEKTYKGKCKDGICDGQGEGENSAEATLAAQDACQGPMLDAGDECSYYPTKMTFHGKCLKKDTTNDGSKFFCAVLDDETSWEKLTEASAQLTVAQDQVSLLRNKSTSRTDQGIQGYFATERGYTCNLQSKKDSSGSNQSIYGWSCEVSDPAAEEACKGEASGCPHWACQTGPLSTKRY